MNPLENKEFSFYLNFISPDFGRIKISEAVKFDASEFVVEQDGFARDISFMNEEIDIEFHKGAFEPGPELVLPDGNSIFYLTHGFEQLILAYNETGFESDVQFILERNDIEFVTGNVNFERAETDELTYITCKVVQQTSRALAKRREAIKVDVFSDEDVDGNAITPLVSERILLKAKPVIQISEWYVQSSQRSSLFNVHFNHMSAVRKFGIDDTLLWISDTATTAEDINLLEAKSILTELTLNIEGLSMESSEDLKLFYRIGAVFSSAAENEIDAFPAGTTSNYSQQYLLGNVNLNEILWVYFKKQGVGIVETYNGTMTLTSTSTAIDSVINGVRYINLLKQSLLSTSGLPLSAPKWESGGEFYDLFAFSGNLIRGFTDKPFYVTYKDRKENLSLVAGDVQINSIDAYAGQYSDFYSNIDNGGFLLAPDDQFKTNFNEKYTINQIEYEFKNYEKDRDEQNTVDAVHTESQLSIANKQVQNEKKESISDIFDAFLIESQRRQAVKETTFLENDNKISVLDVVTLAPGSLGGFTAGLYHQYDSDDDLLQLLNDGTYNWSLLGFGVGDSFTILNTDNTAIYTVAEITPSVLNLTPVAFGPTSIGQVITEVSYPYTNVLYTNRTNEGFDLIEGVENPENFSNLRYTIRRNLVHWEPYINTACSFTDGDVRNTFFQTNGELTTQFNGGQVYKENEDIPVDSLQDKILSPKLYDQRIIVEYDDALALLQKYQDEATLGGFIRVQDNKGAVIKLYPKRLGYTWATKVMSVIGEARHESDVVTITSSGGIIIINEVGYDQILIPEVFWNIINGYVMLFDNNSVNLINLTRIEDVQVSGQTYLTAEELSDALNAL